MTSGYDVVVGGGSVAGLTFAGEAARRGLEVLVLEEDAQIGEPEKCDGLVSLRELRRYMAPSAHCIQSYVRRGIIHSPSGETASLDATKLEVVVLDRSEYDRQLMERAEAWGAKVKRGSRISDVTEKGGAVRVVADSTYEAKYYVDATGPSAAMIHGRRNLIPAAKYEVEGDWFNDGDVEVFLDQEKYPGFFAWVIPRGDGVAKVGAAGRGINSFRALDSFLSDKKQNIVRKVAAPIYVGGAISEFVSGRKIYVGESAGQVKPTTAGGITTSAAAGVIAARWVSDSLNLGDPSVLKRYQTDWEERFGREFRLMARIRKVLEGLTNRELDSMVAQLGSDRVRKRLASSDFDYHASSLLSALGVAGVLRLARVIVSAEARELIASLAQ